MEIDLSNVNQIDMECAAPDDDDIFFIASSPAKSMQIDNDTEDMADDRPLKPKTGVIISFDDDSDKESPMKVLKFDSWDDPTPQATMQFTADNSETQNFNGINAIDMECKYADDDEEFGSGYLTSPVSKDKLDFGDDDFNLIDEDMVRESKKQMDSFIDQGKVEDDFYDKLKKKHAATNKKGAYNTHFHFAGNPKVEMDDFNDMMTPTGPVPNMVTASAEAAETAAVAESKNNPSYRTLFEDLLKITGFEVKPAGKGRCMLRDLYTAGNEQVCDTINSVETFLTPYVEDCFIVPLQVETNQKFKNCKDWVKWYTPEMQAKYPQCAADVKYCDVFGNHLAECKLF